MMRSLDRSKLHTSPDIHSAFCPRSMSVRLLCACRYGSRIIGSLKQKKKSMATRNGFVELVRRFVFEADFSLLISDKSINRSDVTYVAGCLFRSIGCVLQIVFALNRKHWMNEKGALALADRFELVPARFKGRVERAWQHLEPNPVSLREAIRTVRELTEEVNRLLRQEGLE